MFWYYGGYEKLFSRLHYVIHMSPELLGARFLLFWASRKKTFFSSGLSYQPKRFIIYVLTCNVSKLPAEEVTSGPFSKVSLTRLLTNGTWLSATSKKLWLKKMNDVLVQVIKFTSITTFLLVRSGKSVHWHSFIYGIDDGLLGLLAWSVLIFSYDPYRQMIIWHWYQYRSALWSSG